MNSWQKKEWMLLSKKLPTLFFGLAIYSFAIILMRDAGLGMNPWGVFHMGISNRTPLTLGQATQLLGLVILGLTVFLRVVPGLASLCNMIFIGMMVDMIDAIGIIKTPNTFVGQVLMLLTGVILTGWGSYFYLRVRLGAGPRDGLMEGLVKITQKPVWMIRSILEISVLIIGYLLGGPVGIGTLITATTIGFSVQMAFKIGKYDAKGGKHINCIELYHKLSGIQEPKRATFSK